MDSSGMQHVPANVVVWFTFHVIGGHVLLPILVLTFVFTKAKRHATLINLAATFIVTAICGCLLLYANEYVGPEPNKSLCIFQAATVNASPPMWATAVLSLILHIRTSVDSFLGIRQEGIPWIITMLLAPYIVFVALVIANAVVGMRNPEKVNRARRMRYCDLDVEAASTASSLITGVIALFVIAYTTRICYRVYQYYRLEGRKGSMAAPVRLALRLLIFMLYLLVGLVFSLWSVTDHPDVTGRDMYIATFSIAFFLFFGTQRDVFRAWAFWRRAEPSDAETEKEDAPLPRDHRREADVEMAEEDQDDMAAMATQEALKGPSLVNPRYIEMGVPGPSSTAAGEVVEPLPTAFVGQSMNQ